MDPGSLLSYFLRVLSKTNNLTRLSGVGVIGSVVVGLTDMEPLTA
jgi:hypothetical protein